MLVGGANPKMIPKPIDCKGLRYICMVKSDSDLNLLGKPSPNKKKVLQGEGTTSNVVEKTIVQKAVKSEWLLAR